MITQKINQSIISTLVPGEGKRFEIKTFLLPIAIISIYLMIIPLFILDVSASLYQFIYFGVMGIPKVKKSEYIRMERWDLSKLTFMQKVNCVYCEYANGVLSFAKAVGNQTEIFSCAIKHSHALKEHEFEKNYYSKEKFE